MDAGNTGKDACRGPGGTPASTSAAPPGPDYNQLMEMGAHLEPGDAMYVTDGEAKKDDAGKARGFYLLPKIGMEETVKAFQVGERKYGAHNWKRGTDWSRYYDAAYRHLMAWAEGETCDPKDGQHHLAAVIFCMMVLMEYEATGKGRDFRDLNP